MEPKQKDEEEMDIKAMKGVFQWYIFNHQKIIFEIWNQ